MSPPAHGTNTVDLHSHLVPAVDDGARTVEDAVEGVGRMMEEGIYHIVTTPHLNGSLTLDPEWFEERMGEMDTAFEQGRRAVAEAYPEVTFQRANEVALDHPEPELTDPRLKLSPEGYVLVEWPRLMVPPESARTLQRLHKGGVKLLLAHPERYRMGERWLQQVGSWREAGAFFQMNYGSLVGQYGSKVRRRAQDLVTRGWVDCLSTDFHGRAHLPFYIEEARALFPWGAWEGRRGESEEEESATSELWSLLTQTNPKRFLEGMAPTPVPALPRTRSFWSRIVEKFQ